MGAAGYWMDWVEVLASFVTRGVGSHFAHLSLCVCANEEDAFLLSEGLPQLTQSEKGYFFLRKPVPGLS